MECRVGEPAIPRAVEPDAVQLQLQRVVAVARGVEEKVRALVDLHQRGGFERRRRRDRRDEPAAQIIEIKVVPAVALRLPDESLAVGEKHHARLGHQPAARPLLSQHHASCAGRRVRGHDLHDVLTTVRAEERELAAIRRPRDAIDIVTECPVVERITVADVQTHRRLRGDVVNVQVDDRICRAGVRICLGVERWLHVRLVEDDVIVADVALVEPVVREHPAVGRPPHRGALAQLLAVDPARGAVLDPARRAAVGRRRAFATAVRGAEPDVAIAVEGGHRSVRRDRRLVLTATLGRLGWLAGAIAIGWGRSIG
jgi:hypothetical protein